MGGWRVGRGTVGIPARAPAITNVSSPPESVGFPPPVARGNPTDSGGEASEGREEGEGKGQGQGGASSALWREDPACKDDRRSGSGTVPGLGTLELGFLLRPCLPSVALTAGDRSYLSCSGLAEIVHIR
jgi:hypothetical protein